LLRPTLCRIEEDSRAAGTVKGVNYLGGTDLLFTGCEILDPAEISSAGAVSLDLKPHREKLGGANSRKEVRDSQSN